MGLTVRAINHRVCGTKVKSGVRYKAGTTQGIPPPPPRPTTSRLRTADCTLYVDSRWPLATLNKRVHHIGACLAPSAVRKSSNSQASLKHFSSPQVVRPPPHRTCTEKSQQAPTHHTLSTVALRTEYDRSTYSDTISR